MQRENMFFFTFPRRNSFGKAKVNNFFVQITPNYKKIFIFVPNYKIY